MSRGRGPGPTKASVALKRWVEAEKDRSQAKLAAKVTEVLGRAGAPVNQSTVSAWTRGRNQPSGVAMVVLQQLTEIPLEDWLIPVDAASDVLPRESSNDVSASAQSGEVPTVSVVDTGT